MASASRKRRPRRRRRSSRRRTRSSSRPTSRATSSSTPASARRSGRASEPWAIFSTIERRPALRADQHRAAAASTPPLGTGCSGSFHRYRIDWKAASVDYYVDGALVASHALTRRRSDAAGRRERLQPLRRHRVRRLDAHDAVRGARARSCRASSMRCRAGRLEQHSVGGAKRRPAPAWRSASAPATRRRRTPAWTAFVPVAAPGSAHAHSRYIQYRAELTTSDPNRDAGARGHHHQHGPCPGGGDRLPRRSPWIRQPHLPGVGPGQPDVQRHRRRRATTRCASSAVTRAGARHGGRSTPTGRSPTRRPPSFIGADSFTYTVSDGLLTASATVSMTVGDVTRRQQRPGRQPRTARRWREDSGANPINVLANDNRDPTPARPCRSSR